MASVVRYRVSQEHSLIIDAPVARVWSVLRNFGDLSWATDVGVEQSKLVKGVDQQIGSTRQLFFDGGSKWLLEDLLGLDDVTYTLRYNMHNVGPDTGSPAESWPMPFLYHNYIGVITLKPITETDQTLASWAATTEATDPDAVEAAFKSALPGLLKGLARASTEKK